MSLLGSFVTGLQDGDAMITGLLLLWFQFAFRKHPAYSTGADSFSAISYLLSKPAFGNECNIRHLLFNVSLNKCIEFSGVITLKPYEYCRVKWLKFTHQG